MNIPLCRILGWVSVFMLSGCVAGLAPIAAVPTGIEREPLKLKARADSPPSGGAVEIYEREVSHNYRVLFSPEGPRKKMGLRSDYQYLLKKPGKEFVELVFLRQKAPFAGTASSLDEIHYVQGLDVWVAWQLCPGQPDDMSSFSFLMSAEEIANAGKQTAKHRLLVFNETGMVREQTVAASVMKPRLSYVAGRRAVRYHTPSGWRLYDVASGADRAELR